MDIYHYWHAAAVNVDAQRACNRGALSCRYAFAAIAGGDCVGWATDQYGKVVIDALFGDLWTYDRFGRWHGAFWCGA